MAADAASLTGLVAALPSAAFGAVLVLCRVSAAVMLLPGIGETDPPPLLRAGLALGLTGLIAPTVLDHPPDPSGSPLALLLIVAHELLLGLFLGIVARLAALALPIGAQLISLMTGLTSVIQPDPELGAQSSGLARLFSLAAPGLLLSSGLYKLPIEAIAGSYHLFPLGSAMPIPDASATIVRATAESFDCAFRLAAPFVLAGTLWQVAIGLLTRLVPSLQASAALMPGQVLGGMILLAALAEATLTHWIGATVSAFSALQVFFDG